jgi:hypothetical protein
MDPRLEKALSFSNYQKTITINKKSLKEKIDSKLTYGFNGGIFKIDRTLISFVQMLIDHGRTENIILIDANENPILIEDLISFKDTILDRYFTSTLEYYKEYERMKRSRSVEKLIEL